MQRIELAKNIYYASHITGEFLLRSGQISHEYFDKYLFESDSNLLDAITDKLLSIIPADTEMLAGLEMGGIPIAVMLSHKTKLPVIFVRKNAKEYGTRKIAEGLPFKGKNILVIEDVVTTGGQIIKSVNELRHLGGNIQHVLCVILREQSAISKLHTAGLNLLPLFTMQELKEIAEH